MIDDERMRAMDIQARLFQTAGKLIPVHPEHVLGLIARVEFAEAQCQAIAEAAIARRNANGIDIDAEIKYEQAIALGFPTWRERAESAERAVQAVRGVLETILTLPNLEQHYGTLTLAAVRAALNGSEKAHG